MVRRTLSGDIDIGIYGASLYVKTKALYPSLHYLGTSVWKTTGKYTYYSYLITHRASGLDSLDLLKGKTFAFGSRESTGGFTYPRAWMKVNHLNPGAFFKQVYFLGTHTHVLEEIVRGTIDAGVVSPGPLNKAIAKYGPVFRKLRKFGPIPGTVIACTDAVSEKNAQKIIQRIQILPEDITAVKEFDFSGFTHLSDRSYDILRGAIEQVRAPHTISDGR